MVKPAEPSSRADTALADARAGFLLILPAALACVPFALILGAMAAQKGLSPLEMALMSTLVFAGGSQFVAVDLWTHPAPWLALGFAAFLVNLRFVLMTASLAGKLGHFRGWERAVIVFFMADENWAVAERRAAERLLTWPFLLGMIPFFYVNWLAWTVLGTAIGSAFQNPAAYGFDFAFTAMFLALAVGFWNGARTGIVMAVSAVVAALVSIAIEGPWYVIAGAFAGMAAAVLMPQTETTPA